jgi:nucleotide-binding universal stress UspA family protein
MFQKILIALGDLPAAEEVLAQGLTLASQVKATVLLLHVLNPLESHGFDLPASPLVGGILPIVNDAAIAKYNQEWQKYAQLNATRLQSYAAQAAALGIPAETLQSFGDAGPTICSTAKTWGADLIILGRNQKSTLAEIFLGSTSNDVLHHAPCSVLTIQPLGATRSN